MAPSGRCYCQVQTCGASNYLKNAHCHKCGQAMRKVPVLSKPVPGSKESAEAKKRGAAKAKKDNEERQKKALAGKACLCCGKKGHLKADCWDKDLQCELCGKIGHTPSACRSAKGHGKPTSQKSSSSGYSDEDFAAEAAKRGVVWTAPLAAASPLTPPTATSVAAKSKVKDSAKAAFDKAVKSLKTAEEAVIKFQQELTKAADAQAAAEASYKNELALVNATVNPAPAKATSTPAMDLGQFFDAGTDVDKLKNLSLDLGANWQTDGCSPEDIKILGEQTEGLKLKLATVIANVVGPIKADWDKHYAVIEESRAKKRRGVQGVIDPSALSNAQKLAQQQQQQQQTDSEAAANTAAAEAEAKRVADAAEADKQRLADVASKEAQAAERLRVSNEAEKREREIADSYKLAAEQRAAKEAARVSEQQKQQQQQQQQPPGAAAASASSTSAAAPMDAT